MLRACTALLVTLTANVATVSFAARNNLKAERVSTVTHVMDQIGALLQTRGGSSGAVLDNLRALVTPGATESLNEALTKVIGEIEAKVESKIKAGHQDTQVAIDQKMGDLASATTQAVDEKKTADSKDGAWFDCVSEEKAKRVAIEEAEEALKRAQEAQIAPCQLQEDRKMYGKDPNAEEYKFGCDISEHGNCDPQMKDWEAEIDSLLSGVKSGAVEATGLWTEAKHACDAAKAEVVAREEALAAAISAWQKQRAHCMTEHESRQIAMCVFGTDLQRKCEKAKAYSNLMAEVDKVGGGEYSHPDRVTEWKGIAVTKCMISKVVAGEEINSATLDVCEQSINFDADVGILDRKQAAFADHTSPAKFTCKESSITFGGQTWTVPDGDAPASSEYVVKPFHPAVGLAAETAPFAFCEGEKPEPPTPEPPTPEPPALETPAPEPPAPEPPTARPCTPTPNSAPAWNNVHVGNSRQVVKTVNLPASGMVCDSIAQNAQNPRWNDRFEVTINGKELSVKRLDVNHGWGQQLVLRCQEPHGDVVMVGNSAAVVKTVQLPAGGIECEPTAVNKQADWWQDRFEVTTEGDQLSIKRLDVNHGWGQKLEIRCRCGGSNLIQFAPQQKWKCDPTSIFGCLTEPVVTSTASEVTHVIADETPMDSSVR